MRAEQRAGQMAAHVAPVVVAFVAVNVDRGHAVLGKHLATQPAQGFSAPGKQRVAVAMA